MVRSVHEAIMKLKLKPIVAIFVAAALALAMGFTVAGWPFGPELELSHERFYVIKALIRQTPDSVIVFGDSIVEGAPLPKMICGHAVVNAGVTGAAIEYF